MNTYKVRGLYTISFEMEVEANSREEAEEMAMDLDINTEWNGRSVFTDDPNTEFSADGMPRDIEVELIDGEEDDEWEDDEE